MCWLEHSMWFWALFKLMGLSITAITNLHRKRGFSELFGSKAIAQRGLQRGTWAIPSEMLGQGINLPHSPAHVVSQGDRCYTSEVPAGTPLVSIARVGRAEGSVKAKYLSKENLIQCLVFLVFEFWIKSYIHSHIGFKANLPYWNPCCFLTLKTYIFASTKINGLTFIGVEQLKYISLFKANWKCSLLVHKSLYFSGQVSNPIPSLIRGGTFLSRRFTSKHLRKVTFVPSSRGQRAAAGPRTQLQTALFWDSQGKREIALAPAPLLGIWSQIKH